MTKKRNPYSPNRRQTNISAFTNAKKQNSQRSPLKHPSNKPQNKEMQDASNPTFLSTQEELYPTDKRVDMNNPFHTLSDDDEVMEDAMEGEITQETEIASQQTGVATGKKASSESSNESQGSGDSELNSVQTGTPPDKDSKPSASSTQEDIAIENRTYSRLSDRDKAIADKAKEANRLRKKELLREYEKQVSAHSVASSSKAGLTVTQMQSPSSTNPSSKLTSTSSLSYAIR